MGALARLIISTSDRFDAETRVAPKKAIDAMMARTILYGALATALAGAALLLFAVLSAVADLWSPGAAAVVGALMLLGAAAAAWCTVRLLLRR